MATTMIRKQQGAIETSSRLRAWWLNTFRGYRIFEQKECPYEGSFGRVGFKTVWMLRK